MSARRNRSAAHPGVSVSALPRGRHRLRWRETLADGSTVAQSWTVSGTATDAERWALAVYESVQTTGTFERPEAPPLRPTRPEAADLVDLFAGYAAWRVTKKRVSAGTRSLDRLNLLRIEAELRSLTGTPERAPLPATLLTLELCDALHRRLVDDGMGQSRQAQVMRTLYGAWAWASDAGGYLGLAPAPRTRALVVPSVSQSGRPLPAPTMEEIDAILHFARTVPRADSQAGAVLEVMRGTGLRIAQVQGLRVEDLRGLDTEVPTLDVRTGKSKQEKRGRTVPLAPVLVPLVQELVASRSEGPLFTKVPSRHTLGRIMEAAEASGRIRPGVWRDPARGNRKLSHWARAGFQRFLRRQGVEDRVIDVLVGHVGKTVRDAHYDGADWEELVAAVRLVPGVRG